MHGFLRPLPALGVETALRVLGVLSVSGLRLAPFEILSSGSATTSGIRIDVMADALSTFWEDKTHTREILTRGYGSLSKGR